MQCLQYEGSPLHCLCSHQEVWRRKGQLPVPELFQSWSLDSGWWCCSGCSGTVCWPISPPSLLTTSCGLYHQACPRDFQVNTEWSPVLLQGSSTSRDHLNCASCISQTDRRILISACTWLRIRTYLTLTDVLSFRWLNQSFGWPSVLGLWGPSSPCILREWGNLASPSSATDSRSQVRRQVTERGRACKSCQFPNLRRDKWPLSPLHLFSPTVAELTFQVSPQFLEFIFPSISLCCKLNNINLESP